MEERTPTMAMRLAPSGAWIAAIVLAVVVSRSAGFFTLYVLTLIAIFGIVATGLTLFIGYTGQLSIGHAAFFGLGAYAAADLSRLGVTFPLALLGGALLAMAFGYGVGYVALRLRGFYLAVVTLAVGLIATQVFKNFDLFTGGVSGMGGIPRAAIGSFRLDPPGTYFLVAMLFLMGVIILSQRIVRSPTGRVMRAIAANELAAQSIGVNTQAIKIHVFALSALFAGLAGGLYAHMIHFITPDHFSFTTSIEFLTMAVIGGQRNIFGGLIGAAFILLAGEAMRSWPQLQPMLYGALLMIVAMVMPGGVAGLYAQARGMIHRRPAPAVAR